MTIREGEDWVDNTPIREAVESSGMSASSICKRLGWKSSDTSRLARRIGAKSTMSRGKMYKNHTIHYDIAVDICRAIDRDPWELGL